MNPTSPPKPISPKKQSSDDLIILLSLFFCPFQSVRSRDRFSARIHGVPKSMVVTTRVLELLGLLGDVFGTLFSYFWDFFWMPCNGLIPGSGHGRRKPKLTHSGRPRRRWNVLPEKYLTTKIDTQSWNGGEEEKRRKSNGRLTSTPPKGLSPFQISSHFRRAARPHAETGRESRRLVNYVSSSMPKLPRHVVHVSDACIFIVKS